MKNFFFLLTALFVSVTLSASVLVTNGLTHIHEVSRGQKLTGEVSLKNVGKSDQRVLIYFKDLKVGCDTLSLNLKEPGTQERSNANWISTAYEEVVIKPGDEFPLKYKIDVPQNGLGEGTFWSALMVEVKNPIDTNQNEKGLHISSNIRYAIQLITNLSTNAEAQIDFFDVNLTDNEQKEGKALTVRLNNSSIKLLRLELKLELYNTSGEMVYSNDGEKRKLYPGQCKDFTLPLKEVPSGTYQAVLIADCGASGLFGTTVDLQLNSD